MASTALLVLLLLSAAVAITYLYLPIIVAKYRATVALRGTVAQLSGSAFVLPRRRDLTRPVPLRGAGRRFLPGLETLWTESGRRHVAARVTQRRMLNAMAAINTWPAAFVRPR